MKSGSRVASAVGWLLLVVAVVVFELEVANNDVYFGAPLSKWLLLLVLLIGSPLLIAIVRAPVCLILHRLDRMRPEENRLEADLVRGIGGAVSLLVVAGLWIVSIEGLELPRPRLLLAASEVAAVAGGVWLTLGIWDVVCQRIANRAAGIDSRAERLLIPLIRKFVRGMIVVVGALIALSVFAVDWKSMIAGLGLGGLLVALAAKDSVENLFGSVTILFDMPFQLGDLVKVSGVEGTVEEINLRSTRIRTPEDAVVTLPNSNLIKASVENFGARRKRRQRLTLRVSYKTPPDKLKQLVEKTRAYLQSKEWAAQDSCVVEVQDFNELSISILIQFFIVSNTYAEEMAYRGEALTQTLAFAEELGVQFLP